MPAIAERSLTPKTEGKALSPFLPGTQIQFAWDSTSLGYLKTCPRLYQHVMIEGWGSDEESVHLRFGQEYHTALQHYAILCAAGSKHEDAVRQVVFDTISRTIDFSPDPDTKAGKYKSRNALIRTIINYLDQFENDPAQTYIMANGAPAVELSFRFELDWGPKAETETDKMEIQPYLLCGHLDRVVNYMDELYVMDHKTTTTTLSPYYFSQFQPNNQMSLYTLAGQIVLDSPVKGVIISGAQLLVDDNEFKRDFTFRTKGQVDEWANDLKHWLALAEHYATINYWPMNDTACDKFGGCRFREICSHDPKVRQQYLKSRFTKLSEDQRWNPLKPR